MRKGSGAGAAVLRAAFAACALALAGDRASAARATPWLADVAYDADPLDRLDIYRPAGAFGDLPFVVFIHAGGWWNGDKAYLSGEDVEAFTGRGVALVAINYRNLPAARDAGLFPPVLGPLRDAQRALQFLRYHARTFALDAGRAALWGDSAGAFDALWLGLPADRARPDAADPVARMSTRVRAIGAANAQTSLDPQQMRDWVGPRLAYGGHAFGLPERDFDGFLKRRAEFARFIPALSPAALVGAASPPVFLLYTAARDPAATDPIYYVHSPEFGARFAELARGRGAPVTLRIDPTPAGHAALLDFLAGSVLR